MQSRFMKTSISRHSMHNDHVNEDLDAPFDMKTTIDSSFDHHLTTTQLELNSFPRPSPFSTRAPLYKEKNFFALFKKMIRISGKRKQHLEKQNKIKKALDQYFTTIKDTHVHACVICEQSFFQKDNKH